MRNHMLVGLVGMAVIMACSQKPERDRKEDLTIVVEADRSRIEQEEQKLKQRLLDFERQRESIRVEKAELMASKVQIRGKDRQQAKRLEEIDKKLWEKERQMWDREAELERERKQLSRSKTMLLDSLPAGVGAGVNMAARERNIAQREKTLSRREGDLAKRERELAEREARLAKREADFLKLHASRLAGRSVSAQRLAKKTTGFLELSPGQLEQTYKSVLRRMRLRGILMTDLPLESVGLPKEIAAAKREGDLEKWADLVEQIRLAVSAIKVDAGFIDLKFRRLDQLVKEKQPKDKIKEKVSTSLRKATQLYADGKFVQANRELNRIFALLTR